MTFFLLYAIVGMKEKPGVIDVTLTLVKLCLANNFFPNEDLNSRPHYLLWIFQYIIIVMNG